MAFHARTGPDMGPLCTSTWVEMMGVGMGGWGGFFMSLVEL
jgi:hypothetical protein